MNIAELLDLVATRAASSAAELARLEHAAGAIAAEDPAPALDLSSRLESIHGDSAVWLHAMLLAARGRVSEAAASLHLLREKTAGEVRAVLAAEAYTQAMRNRDRFGDNGLTGVLIAIPEGDALRVDTWLMSCRVLGRRPKRLRADYRRIHSHRQKQPGRRSLCPPGLHADGSGWRAPVLLLGCSADLPGAIHDRVRDFCASLTP